MAALGSAAPAHAIDAAWSGFATLGWARTDTDYRYLRSIDRDGSFERDSLVAGQLDLQLAPRWSATAQVRLAGLDDRADGVRAGTTWAFVAWRPADAWLLRAGRMRLPLYLQSESLDVAVARDLFRMPQEVYSLTPTNDFDGVHLGRSAPWGAGEWAVDAFTGSARTAIRLWMKEGYPPFGGPGAYFQPLHSRIAGLALTARDDRLVARVAVGTVVSRPQAAMPVPVTFPRVELAPGAGYWKVDDAMPGPPIDWAVRFRNTVYTAGAEWQFGAGWRVAGEAVRIRQSGTELGSDSRAAYLALFRRSGAWTPYASVARQRSSNGLLEWHRRLTEDGPPADMPGAAEIVAAQRIAADTLYVFDQRSWALGTSYTVSARAKLHAEWLRTAVGRTSSHFDTPTGQPGSAGLRAHTVSLGVGVAF